MKGWRGSPARHALAAKGISIANGQTNAQRPAAVPITARPQREPMSVGEVFDVITSRAFSEAGSSQQAEALLSDRGWIMEQIHSESAALQLSIAESAELENTLLAEFDLEPSITAGLVQVVDQLKPKTTPPAAGVQP